MGRVSRRELRLWTLGLAAILVGLALVGSQVPALMHGRSSDGAQRGVQSRVTPWVEPVIGANVGLMGLPPEQVEAVLDAARGFGFTWLRQEFHWADIESVHGYPNWEAADAVVQTAAERGITLVAVLGTSPEWARPAGQEQSLWCPPDDFRYYGDFVAEFAFRYRDQLKYYQVWDQPNIYPYWGDRYVDVADYGRLLREGASRIRAMDPDAIVLMAALAPNVETGPLNLNERDYLRGVLASGAAPYFDVASLKAYGFEAPADEAPAPQAMNFARMASYRDVLVEAGLSQVPVWAASFGWNSLPEGWTGKPSPWGSGPLEDQVAQVEAGIRRAREQWPWAGPMFWASMHTPAEPADPAAGFALVNAATAQWTPYGAALLGPLHSVMQTARLGWHSAGDGMAMYHGAWRVAGEGADPGRVGDSVEIRFYGTALDLLLSPGPYTAAWIVEVDGVPSAALPWHEGQARLVLRDPLGQPAQVTVARGLSLGEHVVRLEADGGWGQWPLRGWVSWIEPAPGPSVGAAALGGLLLAMGAVALWGTGAWGALVTWLLRPRPLWAEAVLALAMAAAGALFWTTQSLALSAVAGAALAALGLVAPGWLLALLLASLPMFHVPKLVSGFGVRMPELLAWLLLSATLARTRPVQWRFLPRRLTLMDLGMALLVTGGALATALAPNLAAATYSFRTVTLSAACAYGAVRLLGNGVTAQVVIGALAGAVVTSLYAIAQFAGGAGLISAGGVMRVRGWYGSPNNLALYLGRVLPVAGAMALRGKRWERAAGWLTGALILAAGVLTRSRGFVLLALPVTAAWLLWRSGLWRRRVGLAVAAMAVVLVVGTVAVSGRAGSLLTGDDPAARMRLHLWSSAAQMIADRPIQGVGPDNFLYLYRTRYISPQAWAEPDLSHPHNLVLDWWLNSGMIGMLGLGALAVAVVRRRCAWCRAQGLSRWVHVGLVGALLAGVAQGLVDNSWFLVDLSHLTVTYLALVANGPLDDIEAGSEGGAHEDSHHRRSGVHWVAPL